MLLGILLIENMDQIIGFLDDFFGSKKLHESINIELHRKVVTYTTRLLRRLRQIKTTLSTNWAVGNQKYALWEGTHVLRKKIVSLIARGYEVGLSR